jgi:hypothetical protein
MLANFSHGGIAVDAREILHAKVGLHIDTSTMPGSYAYIA